MLRAFILSLALVACFNAPLMAKDSVTAITVSGDKPATVTGNLNSGKKIPLEWAEKSNVACFPGTRFEMFDGNHVFYRVTLPPKKKINIKLTPVDKSKVINLYALRQGAGKQAVPPNITSAISAEASYPIYAKRGGKVIKNADDGTRKIDFISVRKPYSILIGVAGAKGTTEGEYKLSVNIGDRN